MSILRLNTITLSLTLLVACGGGGGGGATPTAGRGGMRVMLEEPPSPLIAQADVANAILLVEGMNPPDGGPTPLEVKEKVEDIAGNSDALLFSEIATGAVEASRMITCSPGDTMCEVAIADGMCSGAACMPSYPLHEVDGPILFDGGEGLEGFADRYDIVMIDENIPLVQAQAAGRIGGRGRVEYRSYGGWLDDSVFVIEYQNAIVGNEGLSRIASYSFGNATETNPTASANWEGVMLGIDKGEGDTIQGDARIVFDITDANVDVTFDNIKNLDDESNIDRMDWTNIMVDNGTFISTDTMTGSISGNFYGDMHQEVGGIFDRDSIIGAFGARRYEILPAYAIADLTAARTLVSGTAPTNMDETQIVSAIQTRATAADTFEFNDFAGTESVEITCSDTSETCSGDFTNVGTLTFSLADIEDLSLVDDAGLVGFNSDSQAVMLDEGVTTIQSISSGRQIDGTLLTFQTYGGWLSDSVFGIELLNVTESGTTTERFASFSFGDNTGRNPTANARWDGVMVGVAKDDSDIIQGKATIQWDSGTPNEVGGFFNSIRNLTDGGNFSTTLMTWKSIPLNNGAFTSMDAFADTTGSISGNFYGNAHEEVGGIFDRDDVIGAFGAKQ